MEKYQGYISEKYQVFARKQMKGAKWHEYSGLFDTIEEAADCVLLAASFHGISVNGYPTEYTVRKIATEKPASRPAECINFTPEQAEVYTLVSRHGGDEKAMKEIAEKYGETLYKWACNEAENHIGKIYDTLWTAACSGDMDVLRAYFENGGRRNRRYRSFGKSHSLIAGAFRTGNLETVSYLQSVGETVEENERTEMRSFYMDDLIRAANDLVDYFKYHNKNTTKAQDEKLEALDRVLRMMQE